MKKIVFIVLLIGQVVILFSQQKHVDPSYNLSFADSVRVVLNNTRAIETMAIGDAFAVHWPALDLAQQNMIKKQCLTMKKRGYKMRPHMINYFGIIVAALESGKIDAVRFQKFLNVLNLVIEKNNSVQAGLFFENSRSFLEHHAFTFQKHLRIFTVNDDYTFDYLENSNLDTLQSIAYTNTDKTDTTSWQQYTQPTVEGPAILFDKVTIQIVTPYDSVQIKNTKGTYSLYSKLFVGTGGFFDWTAAGLSADSVNYELNKYHFKATQAYIRAEQGSLLYLGKLNGRIPGQLEFKSINHKTKKSTTYPRFKSYKNNIELLGLSPAELKYNGGFGLIGANQNSLNITRDPSTLELHNSIGNKRVKVHSPSFAFKDSLIIATNAYVSIYQDNDSLSHPSLYMRYDLSKQKIIFSKDQSALRKAPFSSSFFGVDFNADVITWTLLSDSLTATINGGAATSPMVFESVDFYNPDDSYRNLRGQGLGFHALALFVNYAKKINSQDFFVFNLVDPSKSLEKVKMAADFLAQKGMITYNYQTGKVHVKDKSMHLLESVIGKSDYDNMKIHSLVDTTANALINLKKKEIVVYGVEEFNLSDTLNVIIKPEHAKITLLRNRDIQFNGTINAGNLEITGKKLTFKYDSFLINLNHIDSIRFYITEKNGARKRVNNTMVSADSTAAAAGGLKSTNHKLTSGTLYINLPNNKSGKIKASSFPRLDGSVGGIVYFDREEILNGAYDKSVFFVIPPFKLDGLSDADTKPIEFDGTFISNGMFPTFKEKLHTMEDKSLGFTHTVPSKGYPLYKGDGKLYGKIKLDSRGIRGNGKIEYLSASVITNDIVFYPDSVLAKGQTGGLKEKQIGQVSFPEIPFTDYQLKWLPKQDKFKLKNLKDPFSLYDKTASLSGILTISSTGVTATGQLSTRGSIVRSKQLNFNINDFGAKHAYFEVKTENPNKPALACNDVRIHFDLKKNEADISPEKEGVAAINFPYAQFKTSIPKATWDLAAQKIFMSKADNVPIEKSYFYTTRKELDSLRFNAEKAEYDIQKQELKVSGIPYIIVADAKILAKNNEVLILENAKIGQLKNTTIILDTLNGYHRLINGTVDIISRKQFTGDATYQYINISSDTFNIKMTDFHLENIKSEEKSRKKNILAQQQTVCEGSVTEANKILIEPRIFYKGDVVMYATRPALQLNGFIKFDLKKIKNYNTWIVYNQSGDEKDIHLDFEKSVTEEGKPVTAGLHFSQDNDLYITFVFDKKDNSDEDFFLPQGSLFIDKKSGEFKIEDREKANGKKLEGKSFTYNEESQEVSFEGPVNFFNNLKNVKLTSSAIGSGSLSTFNIKLNALLMIDMGLPTNAYQLMAENIQTTIKNEGLAEGQVDPAELLYKLANIVGEKIARDYEKKSQEKYLSLGALPVLQKNLVISNVNMKWSDKQKAFYSHDKLSISNINHHDINGAFEGFMEIKRSENGTSSFHLFFKVSSEDWYYFGLEDNRLMVYSSNPAFNAVIAKNSSAKKIKQNEAVLIAGSEEETISFINTFRHNYYGIETPYDLTTTISSEKKNDNQKSEKEDDGF